MPWHRSDDRFPEHPKCDALAERFGDDWAALHLAFALWHHMGCDCAARRTDGVFNAQRAYRIMRAPREAIDRAIAGLLAVGLLDKHRDGVVFHDWSDYQPTRSEIDAERAAKTERQRRWRKNLNEKSALVDGDVDAPTDRLVDGGVDAAPSRPVPTRPEGETTSLLSSPAPKARATVAGGAGKAKAPKACPLPFSLVDGLSAIAAEARGRFVVGQREEWSGGHVIAAQKAVRKFPDLATWRLVGAWLGAGHEAFRGTVSIAWVASATFANAVTLARDWEAKGRPAPGGADRGGDLFARPRRVGPAPVSTAEEFARDALEPDPLIAIARGQ